jgi:hypothetical protein
VVASNELPAVKGRLRQACPRRSGVRTGATRLAPRLFPPGVRQTLTGMSRLLAATSLAAERAAALRWPAARRRRQRLIRCRAMRAVSAVRARLAITATVNGQVAAGASRATQVSMAASRTIRAAPPTVVIPVRR